MSLATETVYRIRDTASGDTDRYGHTIPADLPPRVAMPGALFSPGGQTEPVEVGRQPVISEPKVYWPDQWPDILPSDRIEVRGDEYEVTGDPADWKAGIGGLVVSLKRTEG